MMKETNGSISIRDIDDLYCIQTIDGKSLLLRVADASLYEQKKAEFEIMKKVAALGVPMSQPIEFGTCDGGKNVYSLLSWCNGEDAEEVLPRVSEIEQYELGVESGKILKTIHSIDAPKDQEEWGQGLIEKRIQNRQYDSLI